MERLQVKVPDMYADHHVLRVRAALNALEGVHEVLASSAFHTVAVSYDPVHISADAITDTLVAAGYPVQDESSVKIAAAPQKGDPAWNRLGVRIGRTDARDAKANR